MVIDEILITALGTDRRVASLANGRLRRFALRVPGDDVRAGDIFVGRVTSVDRRLAAAFVDIGAERAGLLMLADAADPRNPPSEGDRVVLRVLRAADGSKGAKLAARPPLPADLVAEGKGLRPPQRLRKAADPVLTAVESALANTEGPGLARVVVDDAAVLAELRAAFPDLGERIEFHRGLASLFASEGVDEMLDAALLPRVPLPSGGAILISETPAVAAIDIDMAAATGPGMTAVRATNLEAMAAIAEAIVLRDLAGHIVIDPLAARDRSHRGDLVSALRTAMAGDDRILRWGGFTPLGLIELTRERRGPSLRRQLGTVCGACGEGWQRAPWVAAGDALRAVLAEGRAHPGRLPRLVAAPAVADALNEAMAPAKAVAEERQGGPLVIERDATLAPVGYRVAVADAAVGLRP
ncbi:ribonuclease E/G [Defluviicoccus vanus]|nr:ribonuclease E/G [Defluviicoccus vanus]